MSPPRRPRITALAAAVGMAILAGACASSGDAAPAPTVPTTSPADAVPRAADAPGRYVDLVADTAVAHRDVTFAEVPALRTGDATTLELDWYEPAGDDAARRPAIVWVHGGGFFQGNRAEVSQVAEAWARRGYVTVNVDYRIDPGSRCMQLAQMAGAERATEAVRCRDVMVAAMHDTQAAVRWVRAHADELRVDPGRIAVGGFSAGALTAVHVAERADDPGDVGTALDQPSTVSAALAASGCSAEPATIDAGDAPVFLLASEHDRAVPFSCTQATERRLSAVGTPPATRYYMGESGHALALYGQHRDEIDRDWSAFLVEHLALG